MTDDLRIRCIAAGILRDRKGTIWWLNLETNGWYEEEPGTDERSFEDLNEDRGPLRADQLASI